MKHLHMVAFLLLVIGGLNWLLWGVFQWEIGMLFGGSDAIISRVIYVLVGLAAVYKLFTHKKSGMKKMGGGGGHDMSAPSNEG